MAALDDSWMLLIRFYPGRVEYVGVIRSRHDAIVSDMRFKRNLMA